MALLYSGGVYVSESDQNKWQTVVVTFYGILNLLQDLVCITMSDIFLYSIHANMCPLSAISPIQNLYNIHLWNVYIHVPCRMLPVPDSKRYVCLLPFCLLIPKWVLLAFSLPHHKVNRHWSLHSNRICTPKNYGTKDGQTKEQDIISHYDYVRLLLINTSSCSHACTDMIIY